MTGEHHPRHRLDEVIHAPVRFSIVAALAAAAEADFAFLRDTVQVTDSQLSKQIAVLEGAGYVHVRKGHVGKRPRTWLRLTAVGQEAFDAHLQTLREIAFGLPRRAAPDGQEPSVATRSAPAAVPEPGALPPDRDRPPLAPPHTTAGTPEQSREGCGPD